MPKITINGRECEFEKGQTILQVANDHGIEIPQYCYHDGLSIVASCRICLAEVWAPNPRNDGKLEPIPKLLPTCQSPASDGQVVYTDSPKSIANQKAVMEYLLINHPLDCPVCDQAGECFLQDYSYQYGRGASRFEETKVKQPKKDLGPHVYLYADRCIMCSRCVRFTREVAGTGELNVQGRGNRVEIDIFPGKPIDNPLSANVNDLCPVGALLDKDFLFAQRVWFLKSTPSIDGLTAGGDNLWIDHNEGRIYRFRPRPNMEVNKWWITDEVRYSWKHAHSEDRIRTPLCREHGVQTEAEWNWALGEAVKGMRKAVDSGKRAALMVSPMLTCEDAFSLATAVRQIDEQAVLGVGPVPVQGEDRAFPVGIDPSDPKAFHMYAEKAPNARGVRRVLEAIAGNGNVLDYEGMLDRLGRGGKESDVGAAVLTGNYPSDWSSHDLLDAVQGTFLVLIDTLAGPLADAADVVMPGATWTEKAGTFENARGMLQAFEAAIPTQHMSKQEGQIGLDLAAEAADAPVGAAGRTRLLVVDEGPGSVPAGTEVAAPRSRLFNAAAVRQEMAESHGGALGAFVTEVSAPSIPAEHVSDMEVVEL